MGLSKNYPPASYANGTLFTAALANTQETKIDTAVYKVEGLGYVSEAVTGSLASHRIEIDQMKGDPNWASFMNLFLHEARLDALESDTSGINSYLLNHTHEVAEISDAPVLLAFKSELLALAGMSMPFTTTVAANRASILALQDDLTEVKSGPTLLPWDDYMNLANIWDLLMNPAQFPTHSHNWADFSNTPDFVTQSQLTTEIKGNNWSLGMTLTEIFRLMTSPLVVSPGHKHTLADFSMLLDVVTQDELNAILGISWIPSMTLAGAYEDLGEVKDGAQGLTWNSNANLMLHESRLDQLESDFSNCCGVLVPGLRTDLTRLQGPDYGLAVSELVNVTGVEPTHPGVGGSLEGFYDLNFVYNPGGFHQLIWGAGPAEDIDQGDGTYSLFDTDGGYINVFVRVADLPTSSISDVSVEVFPMNVGDLYNKIDDLQTGANVSAHIAETHGDALVLNAVWSTNGSDRTVSYSEVAADVGGTRHPSLDGLSGSVLLANTDLAGSTVLTGEARVDLIYIDSTNTVAVAKGTKFKVAYGIASYPTLPANSVVGTYVYVPANADRPGLVASDILGAKPEGEEDWQARQEQVLDAVGLFGAAVDLKYGYGIERARLISGIALRVDRLFAVQPPTNVTGVVLTELNDTQAHLSFYNTSTPGYYTLAYVVAGQTLSWGGGATVAVGAGGTFTLLDSSGTRGIRATVTPGSLPGGNQSDVNLQVGNLPTPGIGRYTISYDATTGQITFDGGTATTINGAAGTYHVPGSSGKYVAVVVDSIYALPASNVTDKVRVYRNNMTDLDRSMVDLLRMVNTGVGGLMLGTNQRTWIIGSPYATGEFKLQFGSNSANRMRWDSTTDIADFSSSIRIPGRNTGKQLLVRREVAGTDYDVLGMGTIHTPGHELLIRDLSGILGITGTMEDGWLAPVPWRAYKEFASDFSNLEECQLVRMYTLPGDFAGWLFSGAGSGTTGLQLRFATDSTALGDNRVDLEFWRNGDSSAYITLPNQVSSSPGEIERVLLDQGDLVTGVGETLERGSETVAVLRLYSRLGNAIRIYDLDLEYGRQPI